MSFLLTPRQVFSIYLSRKVQNLKLEKRKSDALTYRMLPCSVAVDSVHFQKYQQRKMVEESLPQKGFGKLICLGTKILKIGKVLGRSF